MVRSTVERLAYACSSLEGLSVGDSLGGDVDTNRRHLLHGWRGDPAGMA
jgi:hypothetical protein